MHCPDYNVFRNKYFSLTMFSDRDVPPEYVPKTQWINPFRYELTIRPKGYDQDAKSLVINKNGKAQITVSNRIFKAKCVITRLTNAEREG